MRKVLLTTITAICFLLVSPTAYGQCDSEDFLDKCSSQLNDYKFVKSFESSEKKEFSYVFSKDHDYVLTVCDQGKAGKMIVNLYDRNHKLVISSYAKSSKKHYPTIGYKCTATGVYYIETVFDNSSGCGVSILGFKK
ncbi:MAG: hypothetical protein J0M08_13270 [Bacteroidetes bacterium]|nr:hypothetical protein [Bacteroidota bacterium]